MIYYKGIRPCRSVKSFFWRDGLGLENDHRLDLNLGPLTPVVGIL